MKIIFSDADLIIIDKPAGLADPASLLAKEFPEILQVGGKDHGACHRLDVGTSGLLVFARNERMYREMRELFSKNKVDKEYLALVAGRVEQGGKIEAAIGPDPKSAKRVKVYKNVVEARRNKAQQAVTHYTPLLCPSTSLRMVSLSNHKEGSGGGRAWGGTMLHVQIKTGRRHQIRAHLASIGHPIVGDTLYKGPAADRLYLHAGKLSFTHPKTGQRIQVESAPSFS